MLLFNKRDGAFAEGNFYTKKLNYNFVLGCAIKKQNKIKTKKKTSSKVIDQIRDPHKSHYQMVNLTKRHREDERNQKREQEELIDLKNMISDGPQTQNCRFYATRNSNQFVRAWTATSIKIYSFLVFGSFLLAVIFRRLSMFVTIGNCWRHVKSGIYIIGRITGCLLVHPPLAHSRSCERRWDCGPFAVLL